MLKGYIVKNIEKSLANSSYWGTMPTGRKSFNQLVFA